MKEILTEAIIRQPDCRKPTGVNVDGVRADLSNVNRDVNNRVDVIRDKEITPIDVDLMTEYWATDYGREKFNNDLNQARNKVERVSEIMKAVLENENKDIGLYYRNRIDYEKTRDDLERAGLSDGFILDEMIGKALAELSAEQGIDDLQIISLDDPNIKEIVGAEAIAGRAYHTGDGKVIIIADNLEDFASAIGTITEEGRHIYHRNQNGLEDSEDYASFYGSQFTDYFRRYAGDTPLIMTGSELRYSAGQLGNDWEDKSSIFYHKPYKGMTNFGHISIEVDGIVYNFGRYDSNATWGLFHSKGDAIYVEADRENYLNMYKEKQDLIEYELNLTKDEERKIKNFFENLQKDNRGKVKSIEWGKAIRLNKKYEYNLLGRNCTTITIAAVNSSSNAKILPVISPSNLNSYLSDRRTAEKTGTMEIIDSPFSKETIKIERKIIKNVIEHNKKK